MSAARVLYGVFFAGCVFFALRCTDPPMAGNSSQTPNAVAGILYQPDGKTPAAGVRVHIRPGKSLPDTSGSGLIKRLASLTTVDSVTTDIAGRFTFDSTLDTGTYVIEAANGNDAVLIDSVTVINDSTDTLPPDTLKPAGAIKGVIRLSEGGDPRKVFVLAFGIDRFAHVEADGSFKFNNLAKGNYDVRLISSLSNYGVLDTSRVKVTSGDTTDLDTIVLPFTGIPTPKNLNVSYDTLKQIVVLQWDMADTSLIDGYNIYRAIKGQNFNLITQIPLPENLTTFYDSTVSVGNTYEYRVVSRKSSGEESQKIDIPGDTAKVVSSTLVTTIFTWNLKNTINDSASINDTIKICLGYSNPTRKINNITWHIDQLDSSAIRQKKDSSLFNTDTLVYCWTQAGNKKLFVKLVDGSGTFWIDSFSVTIIQDIPEIKISGDTIIEHGGTVQCTVYAQQKFGTMTLEVDSANSGYWKIIGPLGLGGGKFYSFPTGDTCSWDSIKVRVTDDDGNVVISGFKVDIRPRQLTITSIDSTVNTITVNYSQSQETDFSEYLIFRDTSNSVDTNSELWVTVATFGTVSYTTSPLSYTWMPRYYRVFQRDKEGGLSAGSNVVYGNIKNSPPQTPVIAWPANDGDSVWADASIRWTKCIDPNENEVKYRVLINYNNAGYEQFATSVQDTFIQLTRYDSLGLKLKVMAYDTLGDSSDWSGERSVIIKNTISDIDGNIYHVVRIGTQLWTVENLATTKYNDGTAIPLVTDGGIWSNLSTPGYCWYDNDTSYKSTYGALYNWYTANTGKLAPLGWHVPSASEWTILITFLGGESVAGGKLKEAGTTHWQSPNTGATNEVGFTALPGGERNRLSTFNGIYQGSGFWSATETTEWPNLSWEQGAGCLVADSHCNASDKRDGLSVRCIRD